jgi:hypothetical protein
MLVGVLIPPIRERLSWRATILESQIRRWVNPPEKVVFVPEGDEDQDAIATMVQTTMDILNPSGTNPMTIPSSTTTEANVYPNLPSTPELTATATITPTQLPSPTPIPSRLVLTGITHEYQQFNNCGPANLSMALSYWGWRGNQRDTRSFLRPNIDVDDKNVMPAEMIAYVDEYTDMQAISLHGGDLEILKRLIAAGFPVMIEKGHHPPDDWWMGHFLVLNGYDDERQRFVSQDSLIMADFPLPYDELESRWWRDFNYVYLVIYPADRKDEVMDILGPHGNLQYNLEYAADKARVEIPSLTGRDAFFAHFNLGASLVGLGDYQGAAQAFDQAFAIYQGLSEEERPYRVMWYRVEPYAAYYHTGRYQDVINLANTTFTWVGKPVLEESFYWRGMAYEALGNQERAISDYRSAAEINPNYSLPREALLRLGVQVP